MELLRETELTALLDRLDALEKDAPQGQRYMQKFLRELRNAWPTLRCALREREWIPVTEWPKKHGEVVLGLCYFNEWKEHPPEFKRVNNWVPDVLRITWYSLNEFDDVLDDAFEPGWYEVSVEGEIAHRLNRATVRAIMPLPAAPKEEQQ